MIEIRDLSFRYSYVMQRRAWPERSLEASTLSAAGSSDFELRIPHLHVREREKIAIVGPSGSGKSTLLNIIAGIQPIQTGEIKVAQTRLNQLSEAARRHFRAENIGFAFQEFELIEYLNVADNILLPIMLRPRLLGRVEQKERLASLSAATAIHDRLSHFPRQISQGQRQRAGLCRALITHPRLVLADEPTGSLDDRTAADVMQLLFELVERIGATLVMATHDQRLFARFDRVLSINEMARHATGEAVSPS